MDNTRDGISKLIAELRRTDALWEQLQPTAFEKVIAELAAQNSVFLELQHTTRAVDLIVKMQDELGSLQKIAIEAKHLTKPLGIDAIESFMKSIEGLGIDRSIFVTSSYFTEAAKGIAQQYEDLRLIDRSGLRAWVEEYSNERQRFISSLFARVQGLEVEPKIEIAEPSTEQIEAIDLTKVDIAPAQRSALITVDSIPLRLLANIMRVPHEVRNLTSRQFEEFVAGMLSQLGFSGVVLTPRSRDGGKDVIASHKINGIPVSFYFECKHYADGNKVQLETLRALLGTLAHDARNVNKGVLVTTSTFTKGARDFILGEARLDGKDYNDLLGWIDELKKQVETANNRCLAKRGRARNRVRSCILMQQLCVINSVGHGASSQSAI